ncbi:M4 family metallopeptidase [Fischerella thermalis]|jgi:Zn-dependent metalloprotease|uniref:Neutral metalloproteinase n=1 Tax=Fischerella thermalis JSC-11 TaxID=741277 RepID=G6FYY2_9CYAN|nr:M4 family metallopeptidase [Fischerella thermalis]PMB03837.1 peptidase M4 family protein [Fischerella thermalis CCMEE 5273]PMB04459.1 peptidase M4 family protein [Fischerella thermalis CCMEE 5328]EHC09444.1 Bacillolysin [Fischerella thermalis JSC-11]PLZ07815.1 peptidase M4 family protein [Fischerella thermalis WC119]PLZ12566.1 peptidase M4 family protein [Fischerella thermalis WC1110]
MARKNKRPLGFGCEHQQHSRCPICCVIPPHMLENIVVNGNEQQRSWAFHTLNISSQFRGRRNVVGAVNFAVSPGEKRRTIFDAKSTEQLPGKLARGEGDPPSNDIAVDEAYDGAGATYDLYYEVFERNSIDDKGLRLDSTVHYGLKYDNAFWNGDQMVYGDGDGEIFQRFTKCIDVIAHELTHGVTQYEAGLQYYGESGAINESFSDVFGSLVKQWVKKQTAQEADWIIGEGIFTDKVNGVGIRSMKAPGTAYDDPVLGKDPQPAHMNDKYTGFEDNGGVHINSGIPNYAFYLAATEIGGFAWEKAGKIWYIALRDRLRTRTNFKRAANIIIQVAGELYGQGSQEQNAVQNAWQKVGVI